MTDYDKYYKTENLFGNAYPQLIKYFNQYQPKGKVLDMGCGQGRNAIPFARLGYDVTGIDNSKVGLEQMLKKAKKEKLNIKGIVKDIYTFDNFKNFDIVLLDSMLHFEKQDLQKETGLINKIAKDIKQNGLICVCIQDNGNKVNILKKIIEKTKLDFEVLNNSSLIYKFEDKESGHKSETKYCMYIIKKK